MKQEVGVQIDFSKMDWSTRQSYREVTGLMYPSQNESDKHSGSPNGGTRELFEAVGRQ